uniref:Uncharacterized protein n=1 Tax=Kalanchoe fedtschenkoi TaxID=63787 RepID=A0A7N0US65_KALFE
MSCFNLQIRPHKSWKTLSSSFRSKLRKLKSSAKHVVATARRSRRSSTARSYRELESNRFIAAYVDQLYAAAQQAETIRAREAAAAARHPAAAEDTRASLNNINHGRRRVVKCDSSLSAVQSGFQKAAAVDERSGVNKYDSVDDAWKAIVAKSPVLRVDERAEEFISMFRKNMMLQKEKSLADYQEMIARGA